MSRDSRLYLADIGQCCDRIDEYVIDHTFESFSDDYKTIDAVARNLEIIGEAVKNIPRETLALQPENRMVGRGSLSGSHRASVFSCKADRCLGRSQ